MNQYRTAHYMLDRVVDGDLRENAIRDVRTYFADFSGGRFERFDGGGDRANVADTFTSADLVAVLMLSIRWSYSSALELLERRNDELNQLLAEVPHTPMHQADRNDYVDDAPADRLWSALKEIGGIGWVTAGKLLARKRPHHVPVYDSVIRDALGAPEGFWYCLHSWFADDPRRERLAAEFRTEVGGIDDISILRCLDIALWMRGTQGGSEAPEPDLV